MNVIRRGDEGKFFVSSAMRPFIRRISALLLDKAHECQGFGRTRGDTADRLVQVCGLEEKIAEEKLEVYWKI